MFRKTLVAVAALGALGLTALAPTTASAWGGGGWGGGGFHHHGGFYGPRYFVGGGGGYDGCYRRRVIDTPWGPRVRLINMCAY